MHGPVDLAASVRYRDGTFEVVRQGAYVICAVTGRRIPLEELRYWSVPRQEAYVDGVAALAALGKRMSPDE
jgi:hypothetical protein